MALVNKRLRQIDVPFMPEQPAMRSPSRYDNQGSGRPRWQLVRSVYATLLHYRHAHGDRWQDEYGSGGGFDRTAERLVQSQDAGIWGQIARQIPSGCIVDYVVAAFEKDYDLYSRPPLPNLLAAQALIGECDLYRQHIVAKLRAAWRSSEIVFKTEVQLLTACGGLGYTDAARNTLLRPDVPLDPVFRYAYTAGVVGRLDDLELLWGDAQIAYALTQPYFDKAVQGLPDNLRYCGQAWYSEHRG